MTSTELSRPGSPESADGRRAKTTLFCPGCGHEAVVEAWRHRADGVFCPVCETRVSGTGRLSTGGRPRR